MMLGYERGMIYPQHYPLDGIHYRMIIIICCWQIYIDHGNTYYLLMGMFIVGNRGITNIDG